MNPEISNGYSHDLTNLNPWPVSVVFGGSHFILYLLQQLVTASQQQQRLLLPTIFTPFTNGFVNLGKFISQWSSISSFVGRWNEKSVQIFETLKTARTVLSLSDQFSSISPSWLYWTQSSVNAPTVFFPPNSGSGGRVNLQVWMAIYASVIWETALAQFHECWESKTRIRREPESEFFADHHSRRVSSFKFWLSTKNKKLSFTSWKHTYVILNPLNCTFI